MRILTRIDDDRQLVIPLGRNSENIVTEIAFDVTPWVNEFGSGTVSILLMRKNDSAAAPVLTSMDGNVAYHALTNGDLQYTGNGKCQVIFTVGTKVKKSRIFNTIVLESLSGTSSAPSPWQSWVDQVLEAADDVEEAVEHYPYIDETTGNWFVWDVDDEEWTNTGVHAKGDKGDKGDTGAKGDKGDKGDTGDKGDKGDTGAKGDTGEKGDTGDTGPQGDKGDKGDKGDTGDVNFATFAVDPTTGMLSATWTTETSEIVFSLNSSGYLEVTI